MQNNILTQHSPGNEDQIDPHKTPPTDPQNTGTPQRWKREAQPLPRHWVFRQPFWAPKRPQKSHRIMGIRPQNLPPIFTPHNPEKWGGTPNGAFLIINSRYWVFLFPPFFGPFYTIKQPTWEEHPGKTGVPGTFLLPGRFLSSFFLLAFVPVLGFSSLGLVSSSHRHYVQSCHSWCHFGTFTFVP